VAGISVTDQYDALLSTTLKNYSKKLRDNIFNAFPFLKWLMSQGRITKQDGGTHIVKHLLYGKNSTFKFYAGYETLDTTPQEALTQAALDWKWYYGTVTIDNPTFLKNRGPRAILSILQARIAQAEMSLAEKINTDAFLDGTGNSSKNLTGLAIMVDSTGTYGGIARATNSYWAAQETAASAALTVSGSAGMRRMYNDCALGPTRQTPNLIITDQDEFEAYEALMDPYMRYSVVGVENPNVVYRRQSLMFRDARMFWDDLCQAGVMYFLNTRCMGIVELDGRSSEVVSQQDDRDVGSFRIQKFQEPVNQDSRTAKFFWAGNMITENCRRLGKLTGLTD